MSLGVLEFLAAGIIILFVGTQIVIPLFRGTQFFPMFRKDAAQKKTEAEIEVARQQVHIAELEQELANLKNKAETIRHSEKEG